MRRSEILFFSFFFFFLYPCSKSIANNFASDWSNSDTILINDSLLINIACDSFDKDIKLYIISNPPVDGCQYVPITIRKTQENKKVIAAILAFPFPFGILGLHRIYLGTKPYMPFAYIGTLGGCFGILPLIDFISILTADDETFKRFENNPKVFMWSK